MDFQQLLAKMVELDSPATASAPVVEAPVEECGEMPPAPMGMEKHDTPPPSISVNLNAQGLDNIEDLMKLMTKVNPDMINQKEPLTSTPSAIEIEPGNMPSLTPPGPSIGNLGNLDKGPLKMLPDLDAEEPHHAEPDADNAGGPSDSDADNKVDVIDLDNDDEKEDEAFGNAPQGAEPEVMGIDAAIPDGNDLNKPKQMTKHSYRQGDNPMAMEGNDLRAAIRAELLQRLAEAKGAK